MAQVILRKECCKMTDSCLDFAKQETERLNMEIEVLQKEILHHNGTKDAWDTILRNAGSESQAACLDLAHSETERLNAKIEAVQEEIQRRIGTRDAWDMIVRNAGSESRICQGATYVRSKDSQWHLQRLNVEIELLQKEILHHNETKDAWDTIVRNARGETSAASLELAHSETEQLNGEIKAVQEEIRLHIETRDAWDTIMRNAGSESRIYQGATYVRGVDGQWHLQQTPASDLNEEEEGDLRWTSNAASKVNSVRQSLLNVCERTLRPPQKGIIFPRRSKEQFQSLGLR
jgi:hypothetical protein